MAGISISISMAITSVSVGAKDAINLTDVFQFQNGDIFQFQDGTNFDFN